MTIEELQATLAAKEMQIGVLVRQRNDAQNRAAEFETTCIMLTNKVNEQTAQLAALFEKEKTAEASATETPGAGVTSIDQRGGITAGTVVRRVKPGRGTQKG